MNGDRLKVNGEEWLTEIVQHWPPDGPEDRPAALDVFFHDPGDRDQWVGNSWIPYDDADLSEDGLRQLFRDADERSWRDPNGAYWRVRVFRPGTLGARGDGDRLPDGIVSFHQADDSDSEPTSRIVAELPPVGLLGDGELENLLSGDASRETVRVPSDAGGAVPNERRVR